MMTESEQAALWRVVEAQLEQISPKWNDPEMGVMSMESMVKRALKRLAYAAEVDELSLIKSHLSQEAAAVRHMLNQEGLPAGLERELRAHLQRMVRLF